MMDDLIIHKIAKANIDAKKQIDSLLFSLNFMMNEGEIHVTILSVELALENLKRILEVQNESTTK